MGRTTRADVVAALGPPSQLISLNDGTVLYYLNERGTGFGVVLIFFNWVRQKTSFDRAIFFFDNEQVLTEYAFSGEVNPPVDASGL